MLSVHVSENILKIFKTFIALWWSYIGNIVYIQTPQKTIFKDKCFPALVHDTFWTSPISDAHIPGLGVSSKELMSWILFVWIGRHKKCAVMLGPQDQGWETQYWTTDKTTRGFMYNISLRIQTLWYSQTLFNKVPSNASRFVCCWVSVFTVDFF